MIRKLLGVAMAMMVALGVNGYAAHAQEPKLSLELNRLTGNDNGCELAFVVANHMGRALDQSSFEIVIFNEESLVDMMVMLDFGALPDGKTKAKKFQIAGRSCESLTRLLVNDVTACGSEASNAECLEALSASTRTGVEFGM